MPQSNYQLLPWVIVSSGFHHWVLGAQVQNSPLADWLSLIVETERRMKVLIQLGEPIFCYDWNEGWDHRI